MAQYKFDPTKYNPPAGCSEVARRFQEAKIGSREDLYRELDKLFLPQDTVAFYRMALENSVDPVCMLDKTGAVIYVNPAFENTFQWKLGELVGKLIPIIPEDRKGEAQFVLSELRDGRAISGFETVRQKKDGARIDVSVSASPLICSREGFMGILAIARDISQRKTLEKEVIEWQEKARRYLYSIYPKDVAEELVAGRLNAKMWEVTILFSDLEDFTEYASTHAPNQVVDELQNYFNEMSKIIVAHNGWIDKFIGDSIMAIFGVPYGTPTHAEDAVRAASEMQHQLRKNSRIWRQKIGINSGGAIIGNIGSAQKPNYTAIGDTVNLAARLQNMSRPREVIIGPHTHELVKDKFKFESLGSLAVKGRGHVETFRVLY